MNREAINKHKQREQQKIERRGIMRLKVQVKKGGRKCEWKRQKRIERVRVNEA